MADIHVDVGAKTVVLDGIGRWCATLAPPENWVAFYHWGDMQKGLKAPYKMSGKQPVYFNDPGVLQFAIDAWEAAAPPPPEPEPAPESPTEPPTEEPTP